MAIIFYVAKNAHSVPRQNSAYLAPGTWDDYSFKTSFQLVYYDSRAQRVEIGTVKIGFPQQEIGWTLHSMSETFTALPAGWFSLGQDVDYYRNIREKLPAAVGDELLGLLGDVVGDNRIFQSALQHTVFQNSLMRSVSLSVIQGQFRRVLNGQPELTDFRFAYQEVGDERRAGIDLTFDVDPASKPPTNIHVLIGRNGVGKTTLLNNMVSAVIEPVTPENQARRFYLTRQWLSPIPLPANYFSSVVSVSFSVFDPFVPPANRPDRSQGIAYFYIGMKKHRSGGKVLDAKIKADDDLSADFLASFKSCFSQPGKRLRWLRAITSLESDPNFKDMRLSLLAGMDYEPAVAEAKRLIGFMSSGHSIVLLTITQLVDTVEEKTLVLMDEPESHLHPPLLSAFTRALSDLLHDRNGVAIIATHSPVVVQEVPSSCVWKLTRLGTQGRVDRPERETFGENVGVLTRAIFGLEVSKSGFHAMLESAVNEGGTYDSIVAEFGGQLGFEAHSILRTLVLARDGSEASKS